MQQPGLNPATTVATVRSYLLGLQARITDALEAVEGEGGARFLADAWSKPPGEPLQGDGKQQREPRRLLGRHFHHESGAARCGEIMKASEFPAGALHGVDGGLRI